MSAQRGTALAETAMVVGLALLVIFNAMQLALLGFYQMHADATAFMTARVQALADATTAQTTAAAALPPVLGVAPSLSLSGKTSISQTQQAWQGLLMLPGGPGPATVYGAAIEPDASQASVTSPFAFAAPPAALPNYFPQGDVDDGSSAYPQSYGSVYLAQNFGTGNGQGWNGAFAEWQSHAQCYSKVNFPQNYSATQSSTTASGYTVDPKTNPWTNFPNKSVEATIYGWDQNPHTGTC